MIVVVLLALFSVLGVVFYYISAQERSNAEYFLNAHSETPELDVFDWGLEQLILGAPLEDRNGNGVAEPGEDVNGNGRLDHAPNSALFGRRHALVSNMIGRLDLQGRPSDLHPYDGTGANVRLDATSGNLIVDQDYDGSRDSVDLNGDGIPDGSNDEFLEFNDSPGAQGGLAWGMLDPFERLQRLPAPDVGYTYPDINNPFLAYRGWGLDPTNNTPVRVMIPSFHRPQYLRNGGAAIPNWYVNAPKERLFRPHPGHMFVAQDGTVTNVPRFVRPGDNVNGISQPFPFQPVDDQGNPTQGRMGVWTGHDDDRYELDVDNDGMEFPIDIDGDGTADDIDGDGQPDVAKNEGIWMDLDFPPQEDPNTGQLFVPLFSYTVYDMDALLNLNIQGNLAGNTDLGRVPFGLNPGPDGQFGTGDEFLDRLSRSNQGIAPSEVNPQWGLDAHPQNDVPNAELEPHREHFGHDPASRRELANMEWWFALSGRGNLDGTAPGGTVNDLLPGRLGETSRLFRGIKADTDGDGNPDFPTPIARLFPKPGQSGLDDDNNLNEGEAVGPFPRGFGHPLDFLGHGRFVQAGNPKQPNLVRPLAPNPSSWVQYVGHSSSQGTVQWNVQLNGTSLMRALDQRDQRALRDDFMETIVDPDQAAQGIDEIFGSDELAFLHLDQNAIDNESVSSRLKELLPANLGSNNDRAAGVDTTQDGIRHRFTTSSWDRKQFGFPRSNVGPDGQPNTADDFRAWEFNADADNDGFPEFPPQFGGAGGVQLFSTLDPFRPAVRRLLTTELPNPRQQSFNDFRQFPLSVNRLLELRNGRLRYRMLTPHPENLTDSTLPAWDRDNLPSFPPAADTVQQEIWARYDRQRMARDIYVLLYTLGGDDMQDYTTTRYPDPDTSTPFNETLREMAQFAVNVVDALDRDNVTTVFEYDENLSDGWGPGDNPFRTGDDQQVGQRRVVFGVEAQQLTFSETLAIRSNGGLNNDHDATLYDDTEPIARHFLYVELRNAGPFEVPLAAPNSTDADSGVWRIVRDDNDDGQSQAAENAITLLRQAAFRFPDLDGDGQEGIQPGGQFSLASSSARDPFTNDPGKNRPSDFRVDLNGDQSYELIAPRVPDPTPPTDSDPPQGYKPKSNLDLVFDYRDIGEPAAGERFTLNSGSPVGGFVEDPLLEAQTEVPLLLQRRAHPGAVGLDPTENPWVTVDRVSVLIQDFAITDGTSDPTTLLDELKSRERPEPFHPQRDEPIFDTSTPLNDGVHFNTLVGRGDPPFPVEGTARNSTLFPQQQFTLWQPHFDRDFASVIELLGIPLFGPDQTTFQLADASNNFQMTGQRTAQQRFLHPDNGTPADATDDNRWYRVLGLLEVPTRTHRLLGDPLQISRVPGKVNLNTVRHPQVLGGMLDDERVATLNLANPNDNRYLDDRSGSGGLSRDWWVQFVRTRDQADPVTGMVLPGTASSQPFRGLSLAARTGNDKRLDLEQTLLRSLPLDQGQPPEQRRRLLELGTKAEHDNGDVDYYTRHRMLSKVYGNSTTRSNVFAVFITVGYFEAAEVPIPGGGGQTAVRIGGEIEVDPNADANDNPVEERLRGFFVVDRSDVEEAYDAARSRFDWRKLVKYRLEME